MPNLLSNDDKIICQSISQGEDSIYKKRAIALLSINDGNTQVKAAEDSTLSVGQVRYFLLKYKNLGLSCFPEEIISSGQVENIEAQDSNNIESKAQEVSSEEIIVQEVDETPKDKVKKVIKKKKDKNKKKEDDKKKKVKEKTLKKKSKDKKPKEKKKEEKEKKKKKSKKKEK